MRQSFILYLKSPLSNRHFFTYQVTKGIDTFDFCRSLNVIVTGGYDGVVRGWNPYVAKKPVVRLLGHQV